MNIAATLMTCRKKSFVMHVWYMSPLFSRLFYLVFFFIFTLCLESLANSSSWVLNFTSADPALHVENSYFLTEVLVRFSFLPHWPSTSPRWMCSTTRISSRSSSTSRGPSTTAWPSWRARPRSRRSTSPMVRKGGVLRRGDLWRSHPPRSCGYPVPFASPFASQSMGSITVLDGVYDSTSMLTPFYNCLVHSYKVPVDLCLQSMCPKIPRSTKTSTVCTKILNVATKNPRPRCKTPRYDENSAKNHFVAQHRQGMSKNPHVSYSISSIFFKVFWPFLTLKIFSFFFAPFSMSFSNNDTKTPFASLSLFSFVISTHFVSMAKSFKRGENYFYVQKFLNSAILSVKMCYQCI